MDQDKQRIIERIIKLMTLADDQINTPEGIVAREKAASLMAVHTINELELKIAAAKLNSDSIFHDSDGLVGYLCDANGARRLWADGIINGVARTFQCKVYVSTARDSIHFIGMEGDIENSIYFTSVLINFVERNARAAYPKHKTRRDAFGMGAVISIQERLDEFRKLLKQNIQDSFSNGAEIMVIKDQLVQSAFDVISEEVDLKRPKIKNPKISEIDKDAYIQGVLKGTEAPLNLAIS